MRLPEWLCLGQCTDAHCQPGVQTGSAVLPQRIHTEGADAKTSGD